MDKKTVLAIALSFIVLIGWSFFMTPDTPVVTDNTAQTLEQFENGDNNSSNSASNIVQTSNNPNSKSLNEASKADSFLTESTNLMSIVFNERTGDIRKASLLKWKDLDSDYVTFNKDGSKDYSQILLPSVSEYKKTVENIENGKRITFSGNAGHLIVNKVYELTNDSYLIKTKIDITNTGAQSFNIPVNVKIGPKLGSGFDTTSYVFEGAMISNGDKTYSVKHDDTDKEFLDTAKWAGYTSKYFLFAVASNTFFKKASITPVENSPVAEITSEFIVNPTSRVIEEFNFYIGPKYYQDLKALDLSLQKSMDYGWFYFIAIPMLYTLNYLYEIFHNYGIAIIFLTIIVKLLTLPLTLKSMVSMKGMTKVQPEIAKLKEKYKNDPAKLNQATMELYKEHNVNPLSGCFPLLLQIPIFFALYKALLLSLELKGAPFFGWLVDLSDKDPYYITPILMGITMFIQQKMTPSTMDPMQQKIFLAMPIVFTFLFISFPSGLVLYWLTNNVLSIIQQYFVNRHNKKDAPHVQEYKHNKKDGKSKNKNK